jgi:DNA-binding NtrC family response regulator
MSSKCRIATFENNVVSLGESGRKHSVIGEPLFRQASRQGHLKRRASTEEDRLNLVASYDWLGNVRLLKAIDHHIVVATHYTEQSFHDRRPHLFAPFGTTTYPLQRAPKRCTFGSAPMLLK